MGVIILQYKSTSNQHIVYLTVTYQLDLNKAGGEVVWTGNSSSIEIPPSRLSLSQLCPLCSQVWEVF